MNRYTPRGDVMTAAGIPAYRGTSWTELWEPQEESVALGIFTQAAERVIAPLLDRILEGAAAEHRAICARHMPERAAKEAQLTFGILEDFYPAYAGLLLALAARLAAALPATFDPVQTMEVNLQRALAAIGIAGPDDAKRFCIDHASGEYQRVRRFFPESEAGDVS